MDTMQILKLKKCTNGLKKNGGLCVNEVEIVLVKHGLIQIATCDQLFDVKTGFVVIWKQKGFRMMR